MLLKQILVICLSWLITLASYAESQTDTKVIYNPETDLISIHAKESPLKDVLNRVALQTGIEVKLDSEANHKVSIDIEKQPLEKALKQLVQPASHVFIYDDASQANHPGHATRPGDLLISMHVLPKGKTDTSGLSGLLPLRGEAQMRSKRQPLDEKSENFYNRVNQRWQARLERLPEDQREEVIAQTRETLEERKQQQARKEQNQQKYQQLKKQQREERKQKQEELKQQDPEFYELLRQQRQQQVQQHKNQ